MRRTSGAMIAIMAVVGVMSLPSAAQASDGPVQAVPAKWTPQVLGTSSTVRQLVPCVTATTSTMYAVGSFSQVKSANGTPVTYGRNNVFAFDPATGAVSSWNPNVNGQVNSIALSPDCSVAYLGGSFSKVGSTAVKDIVEVSATTGAVIPAFEHSAGAQVETLQVYGTHVLAGGYFKTINGSGNKFMASLDSTTGHDDGFLNLKISGNYQFPGVAPNGTRVWNSEVSHDGSKLLVMGDFTSVGGLHREQIFMLDLTTGLVTDWNSDSFYDPCATVEPFYVQAAAWSPDDQEIYISTTGYKPYNLPSGGFPRSGLCDAAAAFPASLTDHPTADWINYTGCDSYYAVVADTNDVYVGGHQRWLNNPNGCDYAGPGALPSGGVGAINPSTGIDDNTWNPGRTRGHGADDMILAAGGLWIASDTFLGSTKCAGVYHPGICFFPY